MNNSREHISPNFQNGFAGQLDYIISFAYLSNLFNDFYTKLASGKLLQYSLCELLRGGSIYTSIPTPVIESSYLALVWRDANTIYTMYNTHYKIQNTKHKIHNEIQKTKCEQQKTKNVHKVGHIKFHIPSGILENAASSPN